MTTLRRSLVIGAFACAGALTLTACAGASTAPTSSDASMSSSTASTPASEPTMLPDGEITVGLTYIPNVQFSAFYLGVSEGIFERHGLDVTLRHHGQQEDVFGAVLAGEEDVVFASADEAMVAAAAGQDLRTFATSYQTYPIEVMGGAGLGLDADGLAALEGRTVGIPGHYGSSYYAALAALYEAGLTEEDVTLQDIGYTQLSALAADQVDFILGFRNNELVQLEAAGEDVASVPISDPASPRLVGPSLITVGTEVSDEVLTAVALAMKEAEQAVIADPEAALDATAEQVPALSDPAQRASAEAVLAATTELWMRDGAVDVSLDTAAFDRMGEFLAEAGIIESVPENPYVDLDLS